MSNKFLSLASCTQTLSNGCTYMTCMWKCGINTSSCWIPVQCFSADWLSLIKVGWQPLKQINCFTACQTQAQNYSLLNNFFNVQIFLQCGMLAQLDNLQQTITLTNTDNGTKLRQDHYSNEGTKRCHFHATKFLSCEQRHTYILKSDRELRQDNTALVSNRYDTFTSTTYGRNFLPILQT